MIYGNRRGVRLGFSTANIRPDKELVPLRGVYAVKSFEWKPPQGVLNIGFNPTFAGQTLSIEVHIFDFNENIYGKELEILFIDRIRDRFASKARKTDCADQQGHLPVRES